MGCALFDRKVEHHSTLLNQSTSISQNNEILCWSDGTQSDGKTLCCLSDEPLMRLRQNIHSIGSQWKKTKQKRCHKCEKYAPFAAQLAQIEQWRCLTNCTVPDSRAWRWWSIHRTSGPDAAVTQISMGLVHRGNWIITGQDFYTERWSNGQRQPAILFGTIS